MFAGKDWWKSPSSCLDLESKPRVRICCFGTTLPERQTVNRKCPETGKKNSPRSQRAWLWWKTQVREFATYELMKYGQERGDMIDTYVSIHMDCAMSTTISWKGMPGQQQEGTSISWKSLDTTQVCVSISFPSELLTTGTHHYLLMSLSLLPCRLSILKRAGFFPVNVEISLLMDFSFFLPARAVTSEFQKLR